MNKENVTNAILKLAECIDLLEDVPQDTKRRKEFRTRRQLIQDILEGEQ